MDVSDLEPDIGLCEWSWRSVENVAEALVNQLEQSTQILVNLGAHFCHTFDKNKNRGTKLLHTSKLWAYFCWPL